MREILFRGKDIANNWHYGVPLIFTEDYVCITAPHTHNKKVEINTIGQYTGLTDKNGTKIFEGDIIQFDYIGKNLGVNGIETVVFKNGKFGVIWGTHRELVCLDGFANTTLEVIGNIHDNPELLKEQQND